jgi:hypothetical protein
VSTASRRRRHGDDGSRPSFFHGGQEALECQENGRQIVVNRGPPFFLACRFKWSRLTDCAARFRDQDIHRSEVVLNLVSHPLDIVVLRPLGRDSYGSCADLLDLRAHEIERRLVPAMSGDARSMAGEHASDRCAYAA